METSEAIRHFQAGVDAMVNEGAEPAEVAGTLLGIAHQLMVQNYGPEQAVEWVAHMAEVVMEAHRVQPDGSGSH